MDTTDVQTHFRAQVPSYGDLMRRIVPFYDEQRDILLSLVPFEREAGIAILDLGCGPGILTQRLAVEYPSASITAFDVTEEMLVACRERIGDDPRVTYRHGDFRTEPLGDGFDVIVASLSLHHLEISERPQFYARAHASLRPGGRLLAAEVIVDEDGDVRADQYDMWKRMMASNAEDPDFWFSKHRAKDHPMTLPDMFGLLRDAGFRRVGCAWRCFNFAVVSAERGA